MRGGYAIGLGLCGCLAFAGPSLLSGSARARSQRDALLRQTDLGAALR